MHDLLLNNLVSLARALALSVVSQEQTGLTTHLDHVLLVCGVLDLLLGGVLARNLEGLVLSVSRPLEDASQAPHRVAGTERDTTGTHLCLLGLVSQLELAVEDGLVLVVGDLALCQTGCRSNVHICY